MNEQQFDVNAVDALIEAIRPFAHPDLCKLASGNVMGDESPVFGRDNAILRIGDFKRAATALARFGGAA